MNSDTGAWNNKRKAQREELDAADIDRARADGKILCNEW